MVPSLKWFPSFSHGARLGCINLGYITRSVGLPMTGYPGADPGFQVRGCALKKKLRRAEGRAKHFWGISWEKSRFYAKKSFFFPILGGRAQGALPPGSAPGIRFDFLIFFHHFFVCVCLLEEGGGGGGS